MENKMLNVRLDDSTEKALKKYAKEHQTAKSNVVKEALVMYLTKKDMEENPFAIGADLFGADMSGETSKSQSYKSALNQKLNEKYPH